MNERRSRGILDQRCWRGLESKGRDKVVRLIGDEVANELELRGANLVDIQTGSTVHWRLTLITMGDYAGSQAQQGDE